MWVRNKLSNRSVLSWAVFKAPGKTHVYDLGPIPRLLGSKFAQVKEVEDFFQQVEGEEGACLCVWVVFGGGFHLLFWRSDQEPLKPTTLTRATHSKRDDSKHDKPMINNNLEDQYQTKWHKNTETNQAKTLERTAKFELRGKKNKITNKSTQKKKRKHNSNPQNFHKIKSSSNHPYIPVQPVWPLLPPAVWRVLRSSPLPSHPMHPAAPPSPESLQLQEGASRGSRGGSFLFPQKRERKSYLWMFCLVSLWRF